MPGESLPTHRLRHSTWLSEDLDASVMAEVHRVASLTFHFSMIVRGTKSHVFFHFKARRALFAGCHAGRYTTGHQPNCYYRDRDRTDHRLFLQF